MEQKFSVDRIEGAVAVLVDEQERCITVALTDLPEGVVEGDMLRCVNGVYLPDADAAEQRRKKAIALQNLLRRKNK